MGIYVRHFLLPYGGVAGIGKVHGRREKKAVSHRAAMGCISVSFIMRAKLLPWISPGEDVLLDRGRFLDKLAVWWE